MESKTDLEVILREFSLCHVKVKLRTGAEFIGYILDVKFPILEEIFFHFLETNKAKRYLAKYNPTWLMPLPLFMIESIERLDEDEVSKQLLDRRIKFYV